MSEEKTLANRKLADNVVELVGGPSNIVSATHCMTRLRLKLVDDTKADTAAIEKLPGVIQVINANGQYQVVVGMNAIEDVYDEAVKVSGAEAGGEVTLDGKPVEKQNAVSKLIDLISGIIAPILAVLCAAGMIKGILTIAVFLGWMSDTDGLYQILYAAGDGFFYFLPIILGYTSAKKFHCSEFIGMTLGIALTYPTMVNITSGEVLGTVFAGTPFAMNYYTTLLGIPVIMPSSGYTSSVIPIILAVWVAAKLEHYFRAHFNEYVKFFFVPFCVLVITVPLTYLVIGPIATIITNALSLLFNSLYNIPVVGGAIGGAVLTAIWQPMVVFGFHWSVIALMLMNIGSQGYDVIMAPYMVCSFAQVFAVLAIILKTKDTSLKELAIPAFITGFFFGITEPCIYGVTLPRKKPFWISCIASVPGGLFIGLMGTRMFEFTGGAFCALPGFVDPSGAMGASCVVYVLIGIAISSVISFVATFATYKDETVAQKA
ncbi:MAG: PTS transporter subunit EIIC [Tractidigestivibacter sp.]|jgi:PTS system beta-glucosides-specific IIC component|uniref:PTS transporter subunit EIIC n=1 Tax=Tractidigestivibacter sp. TaxID=2847320 RepID=UPI003D8A7572